ncbi:MAG TPA: EamA family transporter RarD [Vicinamibacterales bacterium]|nr:EamA family transporter RarD [Vicinamibacterales bacterium]
MSGVWYGVAAYSLWGLLTLYWRLFPQVPAIQVLAHRIVWSFVVLAAIVAASWGERRAVLRTITPGVIVLYAVAAVLIGVNWFLYVFSVNHGFIVESSLGYFMTPLVNVLMGVAVFRERLRATQWLAVAFAFSGVLWLTLAYGTLPWIGLALAASFGSYGLVKKKATLPSLEGLTLETAVLVVPAVLFLAVLDRNGDGAFLRSGTATDALLAAGGIVTVVPLLLFATAVRRIPLSVIGILQYIAPTIQFLLGVYAFHEPFTRTQLTGFGLVWLGLVVFTLDSVRARPTPSLAVVDEGVR